ncbi:hypothetical protein TcWFU_009001 [Taenia crassiceps]|uniref:Uncharacterized protein n=1 Tax=Taenia crassiceps TaxID=6207 RepID=A0ABR4Q7M0_9CEST
MQSSCAHVQHSATSAPPSTSLISFPSTTPRPTSSSPNANNNPPLNPPNPNPNPILNATTIATATATPSASASHCCSYATCIINKRLLSSWVASTPPQVHTSPPLSSPINAILHWSSAPHCANQGSLVLPLSHPPSLPNPISHPPSLPLSHSLSVSLSKPRSLLPTIVRPLLLASSETN